MEKVNILLFSLECATNSVTQEDWTYFNSRAVSPASARLLSVVIVAYGIFVFPGPGKDEVIWESTLPNDIRLSNVVREATSFRAFKRRQKRRNVSRNEDREQPCYSEETARLLQRQRCQDSSRGGRGMEWSCFPSTSRTLWWSQRARTLLLLYLHHSRPMNTLSKGKNEEEALTLLSPPSIIVHHVFLKHFVN